MKSQTQLKGADAEVGLQLPPDVEWKAFRRFVLCDDGMVDYHIDPLAAEAVTFVIDVEPFLALDDMPAELPPWSRVPRARQSSTSP